MNFLRKAGVIFMMLAIFATSCNKYADDFDQLNKKLDAMATTVNGLGQLQTDMTALKAQVTALQTLVATLPTKVQMDAGFTAQAASLAAVSAKIDALTTTLGQVKATGDLTKAVVDGLKADLAKLATTVAADNAKMIANGNDALAKITALDGKVTANQTAVLAQLAVIGAQATALAAQVTAENATQNAKIDASAAASAAASANILVEMAANQLALVTQLGAMTATQAAQFKAVDDAIKALDLNVAAQLTAMTGANTANMNTILASQATLTAAMDAQFATMTAADLANLVALQASLAATEKALADQATANQAVNEFAFTELLLAQAAQTAQDAATALATANALAQLQISADGSVTADQAAAAALAALKVQLDAQAVALKIILDNTSMYNGDVVITNDAEVDFYLAKLAQLGIINGQGATALTVNYAGISASRIADANMICSKIKSIIGSGNANITFKTGNAVDLSSLSYVKGNMYVKGDGATTGADVKLNALTNVSGTLKLEYDGPYESATLATVGGDLILTNINTATGSNARIGTTSINFPALTVTWPGRLFSAGNPPFPLAVGPSNPVFGSVTGSIVVGGDMASLTAYKATSITLKNANYSGSLVVNPVGTTPLATSVDMSACTNINYVSSSTTTPGGTLVINTAAGGTVSLTKFLGRSGSNTYVREDVEINGPTTLDIPVWVLGQFKSTTVKTLSMGKFDWTLWNQIPQIDPIFIAGNVLENLTLGNAKAAVWLNNYTKLVTATIAGNDATIPLGAAVLAFAANTDLTTVSVSGLVGFVGMFAPPKLTSFTTAGTINHVEIDNADLLAGVNMTHQHQTVFNGSILKITNNDELLALTTSTDKPQILQVENNAKLATADFSSYKNFLFFNTMSITIRDNKFGGSYTKAVAATPTDGYIQSKLTCAPLSTLKGLFAAYDADQALGALKTSTATWAISVNLKNVTLTGESPAASGAAAYLGARMNADAAHTVPFPYTAPATSGIIDPNGYAQLKAILQ